MIPIKYIGHRPIYRDGACGSNLAFEQWQTILVDDEFAVKMLRHPSVYERGVDESAIPAAPMKKAVVTEDEDPDQTARDAIANLNKDALATYAKTHFGVDIDKRKNVGDLRQQVTMLFDQYGIE
jgi:hypothetical protein